MTRYFDVMSRELELHGGTIEKFIGDAVMAVFGLPTLHEDDALRAVRAAAGMQRALAELNDELERVWGVRLTNRTGVNTGEVVAGNPSGGQRLVTGDAVNTAARLEQAAPANEVLIGELTYRLVRHAVQVEPVEPLELKGKAERVPAYRLVSVRASIVEGWARHENAPIVGRHAELGELLSRYGEADRTAGGRMVTIVGEAGVGKSRLTRAFSEAVADEAEVFRGRCLPYGDGITFWPLVEVARAAAGIREDDSPELARSRVLGLVSEPEVAARIASILGLTPAQFPLPELYWGARKLLESLAARRPLVVVFDDIHWAEPAFLDFIDHVVDTAEAPILLICTARHELLDSRPEWGDRLAASRLVLGPLDDTEAAQVVANLLGQAGLPADVEARIVGAAEGNPLFVEQMLSMLIDSGTLRFDDGRWIRADELAEIAVPPTIQALLAARLDQLSREERAVIEPASVIGLEFVEPAVVELAPEPVRPAVPAHLGALARKQFLALKPDQDSDDTGYRFLHLLVREAAYGGLLKRARATHHERFVVWADRVNAERGRGGEYEEILGYHLEQAHRYLGELGPLDDHGRALGADAARRLSAAGRRAFARGDMHAAANLYRRAVGLLAEHDPNRLALLPELGEALIEQGEFGEARGVLDGAMRAADEIFDDGLRAHAALIRVLLGVYAGDEGDARQVEARARDAVRIFERLGDDAGLARAWRLVFGASEEALRYGEATRAAENAIKHARKAGDSRQVARGMTGYALAALYGPTPVADAIARCEALLAEASADRRTEALVSSVLAHLYAMEGRFEAAREQYRGAQRMLEDLGSRLLAASTSIDSWRIEILADNPEAAESELRRDYAALEAMGEKYLLSTVAAFLGQVMWVQGNDAEALRFSEAAEQLAADGDVTSQSIWRSVRAKVLARRGDAEVADRLSIEAVDLVAPTEAPLHLADALADRAEVLRLLGRDIEAGTVLEEAARIYADKGDRVSAERARRFLRDLKVA
jgi:tetratricopeptide (TPR) repeat protein